MPWSAALLAAALAVSAPARAQQTPPAEGGAPPKYLMAAIGDSISAALFAGTSLTELNAEVTLDDVDAAWSGWRLFEKKYTLSWTSGKDIPSHYRRLSDFLKAQEGAELDILNTANTGNKAEDIVGQARLVAEAMKGGRYRSLKYATLMIGANDACSAETAEGTPDGVMRDSVKAALGILAAIEQDEPVRVMVSAIPNVPSLGAEAIRGRPFFRDITCGMLWEKVGICQGLLNWKTPEEYKARLGIVARKNQALRSALAQVQGEHPNLEIVFSARIFQQPASPENMAVDCFHPNQGSHRSIAAQLWQEQPWFPPKGEAALARNRDRLAESRRGVQRAARPAGLLLGGPGAAPVVP